MAEGTEPSDLVRFAEKLIGLLDQGSFVSTYKYAVLLGLMDLCLEQGGRDGAPPAMVTTRQLARKVIGLYWPHTRPFQVPGHPARVLKQNPDRQARIVSLVAEYRASRAADPSAPLYRAREEDRRGMEALEREVEWKLVEMPLPKLQRVGGQLDDFVYRIGWNDGIKRSRFGKDFDNRIHFRPGAAGHLVALAAVIRPLVHRQWVLMVTRLNGVPESRLEDFLFERDRSAVAVLAGPLQELQRGRCFYCDLELGRKQREVDHFIPWARHPDDGIANLVLADVGCNRSKRDFLADLGHVERWGQRLSDHGAELGRIATELRRPRDESTTTGVLRSIYAALPAGVMLWRSTEAFSPLDRARVGRALEAIPA